MPRKIRQLIRDLRDDDITVTLDGRPGDEQSTTKRRTYGKQSKSRVANLNTPRHAQRSEEPVSKKSNYTDEELAEASRYEIVIQWSEEDQIYIASVPELPGAKTHGNSPAEAAEKVVEVAAHWIYGSRQLGHRVPEP